MNSSHSGKEAIKKSPPNAGCQTALKSVAMRARKPKTSAPENLILCFGKQAPQETVVQMVLATGESTNLLL
jgi:hypothetical protein